MHPNFTMYRRSGDRARDSCGRVADRSREGTALHATAVWLFQPAIATDDLAACSCFQKRLRQLVNLSEKGKRDEGTRACTFHTASQEGARGVSRLQVGLASVAAGFEPQPRSNC